ncbi:MAG: choice-of-anchor tandem repeat GloVer-containing protein [Verrucomicrobiota bacterium]
MAVAAAVGAAGFLGMHAAPAAAAVSILTTLSTFSGANGASPYAGVSIAPDGTLFGTTSLGGAFGAPYGLGTLFRVQPKGGLASLFSFAGSNGAKPWSELLPDEGGLLWGTTYTGGASNLGTIFSMTTNGALTSRAAFTGANGANPSARLTYGPDGALYGTTQSGGDSGLGTVFRFSTNGGLVTLASFNGANGANPYAPLVLGSDGNFYGTTVNGGDSGLGTVFRITPQGTLSVLWSFDGVSGSNPYGGLEPDAAGQWYGTTAYGGSQDAGTIFRLGTNGTLDVVYEFTGGADGANPWAGLSRGADGNLYGTTLLGGDGGWGTAYQITPAGLLTPMIAFGFNAGGASPRCRLRQGADGAWYGTTSIGGANGKGTVFRIDPAPPAMGRVAVSSDTISFSWEALPGQVFQVQSADDSSAADGWVDAGPPLVATNSTVQFSDLIAPDANRVYRVLLR